MEHLLEVKNLTVLHKKNASVIKAVDDVSFYVDRGEILGIAGVSGCGKTTLALAVPSLLSQRSKITQGEILYKGNDLVFLNEEELCRLRGKEVSIIFQETKQALNPLLKVGKQITETLELGGSLNKRENKKLALEMLARLEFSDAENIYGSYPHELSGGMCQRVMTAIAAISAPSLLLADEPSSSQDAESQERILSLLLEMNRNHNTTIIIISHDLSIIRQFCTRYFIMSSGKIIEENGFASLSFPQKHIQENPEAASAVPQIEPLVSPLLSVRNVSNVYVNRNLAFFGKKETKPVLHNVNLEIRPGEIVGLTGISGCGKTTLANCILGIVDYEGEILIDGDRLQNSKNKSSLVQMVFQEPGVSLNPLKKIGWLMEEPLVIHKTGFVYKSAQLRAQKVDEMLHKVGLDASYKTRKVNELSGGQKQRVCIGRALLLEPRLLIADEAISSLDVSSGVQILDLLKELRESLGLAILFISHNKDAVKYLCDRAVEMKEGRLFFPA